MRRVAVASGAAALSVIAVLWLFVWSSGESKAVAGFSFNAAYQAAAPGDVIKVPAGAIAEDYPNEGATKILAATKSTNDPVTFECESDTGLVTFADKGQLVITTRQPLVIRGRCFRFANLWVGDPANGVSAASVTIDGEGGLFGQGGASMQSFDISGSDDVALVNLTVGPSVAGPDNPNYSEPKVHTGGPDGAIDPRRILLQNITIHDIQTEDAARYHTGCLWVGYGQQGSLAIRGSWFYRCAIYDIHVDASSTPNLTVDGSTLEAPRLPLDQGDAPAPASFTELQVKCQDGQRINNYLITNSKWEHGWNLQYGGCQGTYGNIVIAGNVGGSTRVPAETGSNTDSLPLTVVSQTASTITLGWVAVPGAGYRFSRDDRIVSHTWDQTRATVKFAKGTSYQVEALGVIASGRFP